MKLRLLRWRNGAFLLTKHVVQSFFGKHAVSSTYQEFQELHQINVMVFAFLNFIIYRYHLRLCHERIQPLFRHPFFGHLLTKGRQHEAVEQVLQAGEWKSVLLIIIILFK
jgi:hypothetical protein